MNDSTSDAPITGATIHLGPAIPMPPARTFWQGVVDDIHTNGSGLVIFGCIAVGIIWPEYKDKCAALSTAASIYLFGAAKNKTPDPK